MHCLPQSHPSFTALTNPNRTKEIKNPRGESKTHNIHVQTFLLIVLGLAVEEARGESLPLQQVRPPLWLRRHRAAAQRLCGHKNTQSWAVGAWVLGWTVNAKYKTKNHWHFVSQLCTKYKVTSKSVGCSYMGLKTSKKQRERILCRSNVSNHYNNG